MPSLLETAQSLGYVRGASKEVIDEASWGAARLASVDAKKVLEKNKFEISKVTANGFKLTHTETGCVGSLVFDPTLKESVDKFEEEWHELNKDREFKHPIIPSDSKSKYAGKENPEEIIIYVGKQKEAMIYNKRTAMLTLYAPSGSIYKEVVIKPDEIKRLSKVL